jgi:hypothetical protein
VRVDLREEAEREDGRLVVAPGAVQRDKELAALRRLQRLELVLDGEQFRRGEEDEVERLDHEGGEEGVLLVLQQLRQLPVHVLGRDVEAELAHDQRRTASRENEERLRGREQGERREERERERERRETEERAVKDGEKEK